MILVKRLVRIQKPHEIDDHRNAFGRSRDPHGGQGARRHIRVNAGHLLRGHHFPKGDHDIAFAVVHPVLVHHMELMAIEPKLAFEKRCLARGKARDTDHLVARLFERARRHEKSRHRDPLAHADNGSLFFNGKRHAVRPRHTVDGVIDPQGRHAAGQGVVLFKDDGQAFAPPVDLKNIVRHGPGRRIQHDGHKMAGLQPRHQRLGLDVKPPDGRCQILFTDNGVHGWHNITKI